MISTYTELVDAVGRWLHRTDLATVIPDFVTMAEGRFNRELRTGDMHTAFTGTLVDGEVALPADFLGFVELRCNGVTLEPKPLEWLRNQPVNASKAGYFAISGGNLVCWPTGGDIEGTYYARIPALQTASTNWLLTESPELYLYATLQEAGVYTLDMEQSAMWGARVPVLLDQIKSADVVKKLNGGPLTARVR
jgi:hypothetical protein